jgi:dihydroflavonol-4-reductase
MTVVVTGANGHVGANLVRALLAEGRSVRALVYHSRRALQGLEVELVEGDVRDFASLQRGFEGAEVVYHLAAHISIRMNEWPLVEAINVLGTRNVVEASLQGGIRRLVHFSSIHAFNEQPHDKPVDESRPLKIPESPDIAPYDRSKAAGEREVRQGIARGLDAIIINPTAIVGPHDYYPSHFGQAILSLAQGNLPVLVPGGFNWVDVRDLIAGAMRAEREAPTGAKYLLSGHWLSVADVAALITELTGVRAPYVVCPIWLARLGLPFSMTFARLTGTRPLYTKVSLDSLLAYRYISHDKATRELAYHPRPFRETLLDTLRWFEENGDLRIIN